MPAPSQTKSVITTFGSETLHLLPEKAAFWPDESTLFIADPHLGKDDHFRAEGVPVPAGPTSKDILRLSRLVDQTACKRLIILGDLFHTAQSQSDSVIAELVDFRVKHPTLNFQLVRGNHDRHAGPPPEETGIQDVGDELDLGPLVCLHEPYQVEGRFVLAGHIHPAVRLRDPKQRQGMRLACFHAQPSVMTLPAFGSFTGTAVVEPSADDRVFAVSPDGLEVVAIP